MTHQQGVTQCRSVSRDFLRTGIDTAVYEEHRILHGDEDGFTIEERFKRRFPGVVSGKAFIRAAMEQLKTAGRFGAIAVKMDHPYSQAGTAEIDSEKLIDAGNNIAALCDAGKGMWGRIGNDIFGIFLLDANRMACFDFAEKLQSRFKAEKMGTVSIGIAAYPMINFSREQILDNSVKAIDHAAFFGPNSLVYFDAVSLNISADKYYQEGDIDTAIEEYKKALLLDPSNVNVHNSLGVCYGVKGDYDSALDSFETAVWLDSEEIMVQYNVGLVNMIKGRRKKALQYFLKANSINDNVYEVAFHTGRLYLDMGEPESAKHYLEKAAGINPDSKGIHRYLGECYENIKMETEAIKAYNQAVKLNPEDAFSLSSLGFLYHGRNENPDIALAFCEQSVRLSPKTGLFHYRLGVICQNRGETEKALRSFKAADQMGFDAKKEISENSGKEKT